jgi:VanZ family protein
VRWLWAALAAVMVGVVLWVTVREDQYVTWQNLTGGNYVPLEHHLSALRCVLRGCPSADAARHYLIVDVVGNFLLFLPVGLTFAGASPGHSRWRRWLHAVAAACVLSTAIEAAQLLIPSRATDVDDVLFNTLGAMLGAAFGPKRG